HSIVTPRVAHEPGEVAITRSGRARKDGIVPARVRDARPAPTGAAHRLGKMFGKVELRGRYATRHVTVLCVLILGLAPAYRVSAGIHLGATQVQLDHDVGIR